MSFFASLLRKLNKHTHILDLLFRYHKLILDFLNAFAGFLDTINSKKDPGS